MLLKKMIRDIRLNLAQFVSIFIMSLLGVFVYAGINGEWYGMEKEVETYYQQTNLADYWIVSRQFTEENRLQVEEIEGVDTAESSLIFPVIVTNDNRPTLNVHVKSGNELSKPLTVEGKDFNPSEEGIWLDESFAKANHYEIGDDISFEIQGKEVEEKIIGLILHPEYVHNVKDDTVLTPSPKTFGFAFIGREHLEELEQVPDNRILFSVNSYWNEEAGRKELEKIFSEQYYMLLDHDIHPSVSIFQGEIDQNRAMGGVFPVVFFAIAALTMLSTMTRMTLNQRIQIGTLKALGFTRGKILKHYVSYGLGLGFVGGLLGLLTGPLVIPRILIAMQKTIYTLPHWTVKVSPSSYIAVLLAVLSCGLSSYLACRQQLREVPATTLRPKMPKKTKHSLLEKSKLWLRLSFSIQWNLRDVLRSKVRSLMAIIGVLGCTGLLIFGFGLRDSVDHVSTWMFDDLTEYNSKLNLKSTILEEEKNRIEKEVEGQWIQEGGVELKKGDVKENGSITILGTGDMTRFEDEDRNPLMLGEDDFGISYKMAELLSVEIGDTIRYRIYGEKEWHDGTITLIYRNPLSQGISLSDTRFRKEGLKFLPTARLTRENPEELGLYAGVESVEDKESKKRSFDNMMESLQMIVVILIVAAVILGSVVLYNLGALSFSERIREIATLKVLGFYPVQIRKLLRLQNTWLTIIGILLGLPAGMALIDFMLATMPKSTDMDAALTPLSLVISIVGTFVLSVIIQLILSRKIPAIEMVSSLKSVE